MYAITFGCIQQLQRVWVRVTSALPYRVEASAQPPSNETEQRTRNRTSSSSQLTVSPQDVALQIKFAFFSFVFSRKKGKTANDTRSADLGIHFVEVNYPLQNGTQTRTSRIF
jgi:hypothetical protein